MAVKPSLDALAKIATCLDSDVTFETVSFLYNLCKKHPKAHALWPSEEYSVLMWDCFGHQMPVDNIFYKYHFYSDTKKKLCHNILQGLANTRGKDIPEEVVRVAKENGRSGPHCFIYYPGETHPWKLTCNIIWAIETSDAKAEKLLTTPNVFWFNV
jgi:hypothetical protein